MTDNAEVSEISEAESLYERSRILISKLRSGDLSGEMEFAEVCGVEVGDYFTNLSSALGLVRSAGWFHVSHLQIDVTPSASVGTAPFSNATDYRRSGSPVSFSELTAGESTDRYPVLMCIAFLKAVAARWAKELAKERGRNVHVDTGNGPMIATPEGKLAEIPPGWFLEADGSLREHRPLDRGLVAQEWFR